MKKYILTAALLGIAAIGFAAQETITKTWDGVRDFKQFPAAEKISSFFLDFNPTRCIVKVNGVEVPSQLDDLDSDGLFDEIAYIGDRTESTVIEFNFDDEGTQPVYETGTIAYIKMRDEKKKYPKLKGISFPGDADTRTMYNSIYGHGAVMENPYNAIRIYMDNRQSIDLYGKNKPGFELETTGFYTTQDQLKEGYGRDILWAGKSVGAGSFRGFQNGEPVTIDTVEVRSQRVLASGPVRSIVEIEDLGWIYNGRRHNMTQRYTMWTGRRDVDVEVNIDNLDGTEEFCVGIQKLETNPVGGFMEDNLLNIDKAWSWGTNVPEKKYPEQTEEVGLGLKVPSGLSIAAMEDEFNYLFIVRPYKGKIIYRVTFGAGREGIFPDAASWKKLVEEWD